MPAIKMRTAYFSHQHRKGRRHEGGTHARINGYFRRYADIPTPITLGHEITGIVHKIGGIVPKSSGFQEGDHVVVVAGWGDGTCRHCQIGNTHICPNVRWPGFGPYGGFAEFIPVPARYLIKVDSRLKSEELAPLTDAGVTPYRGLKKLRDAGALGPNRVLGVFGVGGLGDAILLRRDSS